MKMIYVIDIRLIYLTSRMPCLLSFLIPPCKQRPLQVSKGGAAGGLVGSHKNVKVMMIMHEIIVWSCYMLNTM